MTLRQDFFENVSLNKTWNRVITWHNYRIGTVRFHQYREWKLLNNNEDWDTITDRNYKPYKEFHTQQELWNFIKKEYKQ